MLASMIESRILSEQMPLVPFTKYVPYAQYMDSFRGVKMPKAGGVMESMDIVRLGCWYVGADGTLFIRSDFLQRGSNFQIKLALDGALETPPHSHEDVELAYVVAGRLRQNICGRQEEFRQGEICLVDRDSVHHDIIGGEKGCILYLSLSNLFFEDKRHTGAPGFIDAYLRELILERKQKYRFIRFSPREGGIQEMPEVFAAIVEEFWRPRAGTQLVVRGLVQRVLSLLPVEYTFSLSKDEHAQMRDMLFREVEQYLRENYRTASVAGLCARFHYSEDYFNRLIKQYTGGTYSKLLQNVRLAEASHLLHESDLSVTDIAGEVGYSNMGYFYKIFTQKYGATPNEVRRRNEA